MKFVTKLHTCIPTLIVTAGLLLAATAHAQWGWTDKDGRRIFSDQGPSSDVPDKSIFKRPGGAKPAGAQPVSTPLAQTDAAAKAGSTDPKDVAKAAQPAASAASAASAPAGTASGLKVSGKDSELEKKKKEAEAAEKAKQKAEEDKAAAARADNCQRAQKGLVTYNSGIRIATTNAKGEREIMSDTDRAAEVKRLQDVSKSDCK